MVIRKNYAPKLRLMWNEVCHCQTLSVSNSNSAARSGCVTASRRLAYVHSRSVLLYSISERALPRCQHLWDSDFTNASLTVSSAVLPSIYIVAALLVVSEALLAKRFLSWLSALRPPGLPEIKCNRYAIYVGCEWGCKTRHTTELVSVNRQLCPSLPSLASL